MSSYAFWNNKGGVGKSFLCFVAASEYAHRHPGTDVYVIDLCPQGNVSEILLGGPQAENAGSLHALIKATPRATVALYLEARLIRLFR
jgi:cellulose biosynthesis protein BcsQ